MLCTVSAPLWCLLIAGTALAHVVEREAHQRWWELWNLRPVVVLALAGVTLLYLLGVRRLWTRAGYNRGITTRQLWSFMAGMAALAAALISPIDVLSDELGSVHMVQHMLIMMIAAPLIVLGAALTVMLWALPAPWRSTLGRWWKSGGTLTRLGDELAASPSRSYLLWQPLLMWALFALTLWILHVPALYEAALQDRFLHDLQHIAFFVTSCLFWRVVVDPLSRWRLNPGVAVLYLFTTSLHASALGVFMAFAPSVWYAPYEATTVLWNLPAIEDQQLAGYIMWMPGCLVYAVAAAIIFGLWLHQPQEAQYGTSPGPGAG
jgi:putative membrane protein